MLFATNNSAGTATFYASDYHYDGYTATARASNSSLVLNSWFFVAGSFLAGDSGPRLYKGSLSAAVAEASYATRVAETGILVSDAAESSVLGNRVNADRTFDGVIEHVSVWDNALSLAQLEALRLRPYAPFHRFATAAGVLINLKGYWPLTESAAATCLDHSRNGNNGTVTGTTVGASAPYLWTRRGAQATIWTPAAPGAAAGGGAHGAMYSRMQRHIHQSWTVPR